MDHWEPKMPIHSISCQALLSMDKCTHMGWLRKEKSQNKSLLKRLLPLEATKVYVILADCCLYYYKHDQGVKPKGKYPLYGYNTVQRSGDESSVWTFVINHSDPSCKKIMFSASSQYEMVEWMRRIKAEMCIANNRPTRALPDGSSDERVDFPLANINNIEEAIYDDINIKDVVKSIPQKFKISCDGDSDNESEFSRPLPQIPQNKLPTFDIDCTDIPRLPLNIKESKWKKEKGKAQRREQFNENKTQLTMRRLPEGCSSTGLLAEKGAPISSYVPTEIISDNPPSSTVKGNMVDDYWQASHFKGPKEYSMKLLNKLNEPGAYMIRDSENSEAPKTLLLFCAEEARTRKYQIFYKDTPEPKYFLKAKIEFSSLEELIYHYFYNNITDEQDSKLIIPFTYVSRWKSILEEIMKE